MKLFRLFPLFVAAALQLMPLSRVLCVTRIAGSSTLAVVLQWTAGAVALLGSYHAVSGASTTITSPKTARGTNGVPFSYRITTGPDVANTFNAAPLPPGLTVGTTSGRISGTPTQSGLWSVRLTASDSGNPSRTVTATLALTIVDSGVSPPAITTQPQSRTVAEGTSVSLNVVASGSSPLAYQWKKNGIAVAGATTATLAFNPVATGDAGTYTVVVTNPFGSATSAAAQLTVLPRPTISTQPQGQTVPRGSNVVLAVTASGTPPLAYQWRFKNLPIAGATNAILQITNAQTIHAGPYSVLVSNPGGSILSSNAALIVDAYRPTVATVVPLPGARTTNHLFTASGRSADNIKVTSVNYQLNGGAWQPAQGTATWSAQLTLDRPGTNILRVFCQDSVGYYSPTSTVSFTYVVTSAVTVVTNGQGAIVRGFTGNMLEIGRTYAATAVARAGNLFSNWMSGDLVLGTNPALRFAMETNLVLQGNFVPDPFIPLKGAYVGLFYPTQALATVAVSNAGLLRLSLADRGVATASLLLAGRTYALPVTTLDLNGRARILLRRALPQTPLQVDLRLDLQNPDGVLGGTVSDGSWSAAITANRVTAATNRAGYYTFVIPGSAADNTTVPAGDGAGYLRLAASGSAVLSGYLADGTPMVLGTGVSKSGACPLYIALQGGRGMLFGWLQVGPGHEPYDVYGQPVTWAKAADPTGLTRYYPGGFSVGTEFLGARFRAPARGQNIVNWTNGVVLLDGGNLSMTLSNQVHWGLNTLSVSNNANRISVAAVPLSGLFSGSFIHPVTRRATVFRGVILQNPGWGAGWFLGTNQSGYIQIKQ